jgi:hypothetical protein
MSQPACPCWRPADGGQCATCGEVQHRSSPLLCGTAAGYIRHIRAKETACDDCRAAHTLYVRLWRARGGMAKTRAVSSARQRALARLARMHPTLYRALYLEEKAREKGTP